MSGSAVLYGVDIGNSGARVAELKLEDSSFDVKLRIQWTPSPQPGQLSPDSADWLKQLEPLTNQPARWLISSVRRDATRRLVEYLAGLGHRVETLDRQRLPLAVLSALLAP